MRPILALAVFFATSCVIVPLPPDQISGSVRNTEGVPLANATVELRGALNAPLCCGTPETLQLTRTDSEGRYAFVRGADRAIRFPVESFEYAIRVSCDGYHSDWSGYTRGIPEKLDFKLEPIPPQFPDRSAFCGTLCGGLGPRACRRLAEFHFGDKTRCDAYYSQL